MRKSLLGILLATTLLPMSTVYAATAAQDTAVKTTYTAKKATPNKSIQDAMKEAIEARPQGMSVIDAMSALLAADPTNFTFAVAAAISVSPGQAGQITAFAIGKGYSSTAVLNAALAAKPTGANEIVAAAVKADPANADAITTAANSTLQTNAFTISHSSTTGSDGLVASSSFTVSSTLTATGNSTGGGGGGSIVTCNKLIATCS